MIIYSMNILYLNKIKTNKTWGAENFLNQAFQDINVSTTCVDYEKQKYNLSHKIHQQVEEYSAVLVQRGVGYNFPASILKSIQRPKILLFTELLERNHNQHYLFKNQLFDYVFVRSNECYEQVLKNEWYTEDQTSVLLSAASDIFDYQPETKKDIDILFVGKLTERRKQLLSKLKNKLNITHLSVYGKDLVDAMNRSKIILNLHGEVYLDTETRIFEALACRGFVLTEPLSGESPFKAGKHLMVFRDLEDLVKLVDGYLSRPRLRLPIATAGYQLVKAQHTYHHRAKQIKKVILDQLQWKRNSPIRINQFQMMLARYEEMGHKWKDTLHNRASRTYQFFKLSK